VRRNNPTCGRDCLRPIRKSKGNSSIVEEGKEHKRKRKTGKGWQVRESKKKDRILFRTVRMEKKEKKNRESGFQSKETGVGPRKNSQQRLE